ncbi:hypothetical protein MUK42_33308 [Musa troglodytarum]|uniref:Uncharacterized protein n=1 Tax=Musa troglodytarum TaxID=320322 RepID=A0A9E7IAT4_9LILI|nr:hypothetical protein MUK42_33308 [Musa troglodytarum]
MASSSQSERKGLKEDQETESSISKTIQRVGRGGDVDVELGLDGGARGEGLADERSFRRTSRDKVFSSSSLFLRLSQRPMRVLNPYSEFGSKRLRHVPDPITCVPVHRPASGFALFACPSLARSTLSVQKASKLILNMIQYVWFYPGERLKASTTKYQVLGTSRYLLSVERQTCWKSQCTLENGTMGRPLCKPRFLIVACQANQNVKAGLVSQRFSKIVKDTTPSSGLKLAVLLYSCLTRKTLAEESMINISSTQFSIGRCHRYLSLRRRVMGRRVLTSTAQDVDVSPAAIAFASVEMEI